MSLGIKCSVFFVLICVSFSWKMITLPLCVIPFGKMINLVVRISSYNITLSVPQHGRIITSHLLRMLGLGCIDADRGGNFTESDRISNFEDLSDLSNRMSF